MYFKHLARLLKTDTRTVTFDTKIGMPEKVLRNNMGRKTDKAAVFDHDGATANFERALKACARYNGTASYSNRNFDLWLLLHKQPFSKLVASNNDYVDLVRNSYGLEKDADIKKEKVIGRILAQIALPDIKAAIHNAKAIRDSKNKGDAKKIGKIAVYSNPDLLIHQFIESVFIKCREHI